MVLPRGKLHILAVEVDSKAVVNNDVNLKEVAILGSTMLNLLAIENS